MLFNGLRSVATSRSLASRTTQRTLYRHFHSTRAIMGVQAITSEAQFDELINGDKPVIIDFWADWCGPCKMISPIFEKISESLGDAVVFAKVDVDDQTAISQKCSIRAMPTFLIYKNGEKIDTVIGADPAKLQAAIKKLASA